MAFGELDLWHFDLKIATSVELLTCVIERLHQFWFFCVFLLSGDGWRASGCSSVEGKLGLRSINFVRFCLQSRLYRASEMNWTLFCTVRATQLNWQLNSVPSLCMLLKTLGNWTDRRIHVGTRRRNLYVTVETERQNECYWYWSLLVACMSSQPLPTDDRWLRTVGLCLLPPAPSLSALWQQLQAIHATSRRCGQSGFLRRRKTRPLVRTCTCPYVSTPPGAAAWCPMDGEVVLPLPTVGCTRRTGVTDGGCPIIGSSPRKV